MAKGDKKLEEVKAKAPIGDPFEAYCVKCRAKKKTKVTEHKQWSNGMVVAIGECPKCGTNLQRILGKA